MNPKREEYTPVKEEVIPLNQEQEEYMYPYLAGEVADFPTIRSEPLELANTQTEISNGQTRAAGTLQQLEVGNSTVEVQGKGGHSFLRIVNSKTLNIKTEKKTLQERPGHDVNLYFCSYCGNSYRTSGSMKTHERTCARQSLQELLTDRQCKKCHKVFSSADNLKAHMKMHSIIKPLRCKLCFRKYFDKRIFTAHMDWHKRQDELGARGSAPSAQQVDKQLVLKKFQCQFCEKNFTAVLDVGQVKRRFACDACLKKYNSQEQQREFSCNRCGRQFLFQGHLQRHEPTCNGTLKR